MMDNHEIRLREALHTAKRRRAQWCAALVAYWLVCLLVSLLAGQCWAATVVTAAQSTVYPGCPRVVNQVGNRKWDISGVLVWKSEQVDLAQVVTAAHLFDDGVGTVKVSCADGKTYNARVVHIDRPRDFAVLHIRRPLCRVIRFAARLPIAGARLLLGGYPHGGRFRWHGGRFLCADASGSFIVQGLSQPGDSGGPILNERNELVGLIADTHDPATCPNAPNCEHGDSPTTGGPTATAIAAATAEHRPKADFRPAGLAARPRQGYSTSASPLEVNTRHSFSTSPPDT